MKVKRLKVGVRSLEEGLQEFRATLKALNQRTKVPKRTGVSFVSVEAMRHATWDIVMAGGYFVTGFGATYFGGGRDPGVFQVAAAKHRDWEQQIRHVEGAEG